MAASSSPPLDFEAEAASDRGAAAGGGISGLDGGAEVGEAEDTPEEEAEEEEALPLGAPTESDGDVGSLEEAPSAPAALGGEVAPPPPPPPPPRRARRLRRI